MQPSLYNALSSNCGLWLNHGMHSIDFKLDLTLLYALCCTSLL